MDSTLAASIRRDTIGRTARREACSRAMRRVAVAMGLLAAAAGTCVHPAHAREKTRVSLRYERTAAASSCADEPGMRDAVAARLGYDPFVEGAGDRVTIAFDRRAGEWHARVELEDAAHTKKGSRALASHEKTCDELVSAVSLAVALAIDRESSSSAPAEPPRVLPAPAVEPATAPPEPARDAPPAAPEGPPPSGPPPVWFASAGGFVAAGVVPTVAFGPRLRAGVAWTRWSVALDGVYVAPASEDSPRGSVSASVLAGGVLPCLRLAGEGFTIDACARALFGGLFGEASRVGISTPSTDPWAAVGAEIGGELLLHPRFGLRLHAGALATLTRTFLRIREGGRDVDVWSTPAFSGSGGLEAVVHFP
jgi:hypothetical protein